MNETVLLTATIKPNKNIPFLTLRDPIIRLNQYMESVNFWLYQKEVKNIVFCDNSNYCFDTKKLIKEANKLGKNIEFLFFQGSQNMVYYGKGYGEGEILKYALEKSKILSEVDTFYKVTGRLKVENFSKISHLHSKDKNVFRMIRTNLYKIIGVKRFLRIDTRFFKVDKNFFAKYLLNAYLNVNDHEKYYLENVYYIILINHKEKIKNFKIYPIIRGSSATTGKEYNESLGMIFLKNLFTKLSFYNIK